MISWDVELPRGGKGTQHTSGRTFFVSIIPRTKKGKARGGKGERGFENLTGEARHVGRRL